MTGPGIAAAFRLMPWCALLYVPFRWRPIGLYLITQKPITQKPAGAQAGTAATTALAAAAAQPTTIPHVN
jgi:hypothetical protein